MDQPSSGKRKLPDPPAQVDHSQQSHSDDVQTRDQSTPGKRKAPDPPAQVHHGQQSHIDDVTHPKAGPGKGPVATPRLSKQSQQQERRNKNIEPLVAKDVAAGPKIQQDRSGASGGGNESSHDRKSLSRHDSGTVDSYIHSAWDNLNFEVRCHKKKMIKFDATQDIEPPCKLQFALDSDEMEKVNTEFLESKGIIYTQEEDKLCFLFKEPEFDWQENGVRKSLIKILQSDVLNDIDCVSTVVDSLSDRRLREKLKSNVPSAIERGKVMIFKSGSSIHIVGGSNVLKKFCDQICWDNTSGGERGELVLDCLTQNDIQCLIAFEFHKTVSEKVPEIAFQFSDVPKITGSVEYIHRAKLELDDLMKTVVRKHVTFETPLVALAFIDVDGRQNGALCDWIMKQVLKNKLPKIRKCHMEVWNEEIPKVIVCCCSETEAESAVKVASKCLDFHKMSRHVFRVNASLIESFKNEKRLFILPDDEQMVQIVTTHDINNEFVLKLVNDVRETMNSNMLVTRLLNSHGTNVLAEIRGKYQVEIEVVYDKIYVKGLKTNVDLAKADLKKVFIKQTLPVQFEKELLEESLSKLVEIAEECKCICKVKQRESPDGDVKKVQNGIYHATWINPVYSTKLTVIEGVAGEMDFDAFIVPTTDVMYPICSPEHLRKTGVSSIAKDISDKMQSIKRKLPKAHIEYNKKTHDFGSKQVMYFVISETNNADEKGCDFITPEIFQKFMKDSDGTAYKTIGLPVDILAEIRDVNSEGYAHSMAAFWKNSWSKIDGFPEMFLCTTSNTSVSIVQTISQVFDGSKGFAKHSYIQLSDTKRLKNPVKLRIVKGNLHETTADIIVNTTGHDLDLSHGMISILIDKHAGNSVQTECKEKYPNGLKKGEVAVTGAGILEKAFGIKKIFHIALSREVSTSNYQSIKEFVRTCLYTAEGLQTECKSIAFPALGTGNLSYARRDVAAAMYAAATEFIEEALHPKLNSIFFVLYGKDEKTCQAFANLKRRHEIEQEAISIRTDQQCLKTTVIHGKNQIELVVGVDLCCPPPSFVELQFSAKLSGSTGDPFKTIKIKPAITDPETPNDVYDVAVNIPIDETRFETVVKQVLSFTEEDRVTGLLVCPFISPHFKCPVGKQVEIIAKSVQSKNSLRYLKEVWFTVDAAGFSNAEGTVETAEKSTFMSLIQTVRRVEPKLIWQRAPLKGTHPGTSTSVEILGLNEETVQLAATKVAEQIRRISERNQSKRNDLKFQNDARTVDKNQMETYTKQGAIPKKMEKEDKTACAEKKSLTAKTPSVDADTKTWCKVTAKVNQGIIDFLLKRGRLHSWQSEITHKFKIRFETVGRRVSVIGSIEAMNEFNHYLVSSFHSDRSQKSENMMHTNETKMDKHERSEKIERSTEMAYIGKDSDTPIDSVVDASVKDPTYEYLIGDVHIKVYKADLTKLSVNCIVSSATPKLGDELGIARAIAKAAGTKFTEECKSAVINSGELLGGDVRVTGAGNLICDSVFHVYVQASNIQKSISDCIKEAENRQFSSIAFPFLGTGVNQLHIEDFANACSSAVLQFSEERNTPATIKNVHFVDRESGHISKFTKTLQTYFYRLTFKDTRVIAAEGNVVATKVCACVVTEDKDFSGTGRMSRDVALLSGDNYIKDLKELRKKKAEIGEVFLTYARKEMTHTCRYILHAVSPQRSREYTRSTGQFSNDIKMTVVNVLNRCEEHKIDSVALPMFGQSASEKKIPTPVPTCCSAMVNGIQEFLCTRRNTCIREIQLLGQNEEAVQFTKYLHEVQWN